MSLLDALKAMSVGETCQAPDECTYGTVKKTCSDLRSQGYIYLTSCKAGVQTITRLK